MLCAHWEQVFLPQELVILDHSQFHISDFTVLGVLGNPSILQVAPNLHVHEHVHVYSPLPGRFFIQLRKLHIFNTKMETDWWDACDVREGDKDD